jgi:uncharacterized membrane protein
MLLRFGHFLAGITWIGLLYYFNFVQTPFFGETEAPVRSGAIQKLVPRALWWFRWGAMFTAGFGILYLIIKWSTLDWTFTSWTAAILLGGTLGLFMWGNVWFVIWPNQKIVIANAIDTAAGRPANPAAAGSARRGAITSRTNVLFSIPMLFFMGAASHYNVCGDTSMGQRVTWAVIALAIIVALEFNALVGTQGPTKKPLDTISGVITAGFSLWIVLMVVTAIALR